MTGILAVVAPYHRTQTLPPASGTTHMLRGTIRINRHVFSLSLREIKKQKFIFGMLLLAESSFAIDVQQDKRAALGDCHLGCSCFISQRTNAVTCFWHHTHVSRHNPHQSKRSLSLSTRKKKGKKHFWNVVACRIVVCDRRATGPTQWFPTLVPRLHLVHTTRHKSCHLLRLI